jgi:anti-sigma B factor antagonist
VTELSVSTRSLGAGTLVTPTGKIMFDTREPLRVALAKVSSPQVVMDLSATTLCDSSGLQLLLDTHLRRTEAGGWLRLVHPQPMVQRVLEITNLVEVLPVYGSIEAAVAG